MVTGNDTGIGGNGAMMRALPLLERMIEFGEDRAVFSARSSFSYRELIADSALIASGLHRVREKEMGQCYGILLPSGVDFVSALLAIWRSGNAAVPLSLKHTKREWRHMLEDSGATTLITSHDLSDKAGAISGESKCQMVEIEKLRKNQFANLPQIHLENRALVIYTSGTTSAPKGVVHTHASVTAQIEMLVDAWQWKSSDSIYNPLPLHHVHGLVNVLLCALWSGARVEMTDSFNAEEVWQRVLDKSISVFMAVPTIYTRLIEYWREQDGRQQKKLSKAARKLRLWVSGSAALPVPVFETWREISGQEILERYGMTEFGMALSNPYKGERRAGTVGQPLPGVSVELLKNDPGDAMGELLVSSPGMFREYIGRPEETQRSLREGWFRTGDIVTEEDEYFRILGRDSVDIIKSGGYKISALEVEAVLLRHNSIIEAAVVGVEDETWGERVAAVIVEKKGSDITPGWLKGWAGKHLAAYKLPTVLVKLKALPRNAMGKVNKKELKELVSNEIELGSS